MQKLIMVIQTSGLALEEIDALFGKEQIATDAEEPGEKGVVVEEEREAWIYYYIIDGANCVREHRWLYKLETR